MYTSQIRGVSPDNVYRNVIHETKRGVSPGDKTDYLPKKGNKRDAANAAFERSLHFAINVVGANAPNLIKMNLCTDHRFLKT